MGLQSTVFSFKNDDALEACLIKDPAHIAQGVNGVGNHVLKIQQALVALDGLRIDKREIAAKIYGPSTAAAVLKFKTKRRIINFAYETQPDNIVGKMTIRAMDLELARRFPFQPIEPGDLAIPKDLPLPPLPSASPTSTEFKIRFIGGASAAEGFAGDIIVVQIVDIRNHLAQVYVYSGIGAGIGLPKLPPLSTTFRGPFRNFSTVKPVPVGIFAGPAHWTSGGGGPFTLNILQIFFVAGLNSGVETFVDTGFTVGIGASSSFGFMAPLNGPESVPGL